MRKNLFLLLIAFCYILVCNSSCTKTIYCPAFPEKYQAWFPYYEDQTLCFKNISDSVLFKINDYEPSEESSYEDDCDCSCGSSLYLMMLTNNDFWPALISNVSGDNVDANDIPEMQIHFYGTTDYFSYGVDSSSSVFFDSLEIKGVYYKDVLEMKSREGIDAEIIKNIKIAKDYGILEFTDSENNVWNLDIE